MTSSSSSYSPESTSPKNIAVPTNPGLPVAPNVTNPGLPGPTSQVSSSSSPSNAPTSSSSPSNTSSSNSSSPSISLSVFNSLTGAGRGATALSSVDTFKLSNSGSSGQPRSSNTTPCDCFSLYRFSDKMFVKSSASRLSNPASSSSLPQNDPLLKPSSKSSLNDDRRRMSSPSDSIFSITTNVFVNAAASLTLAPPAPMARDESNADT
mmetsp:Transcript_4195/g.15377  ORF Transcript_4195/g.15377 Transcript_4195/m.15377 type:complete len:208 (-) Transcript_4195:1562-2185(-)